MSCPSGCSCGTDYRQCQDVTKSDKFLPSSLVIKVWLKDSYVDVEKLMDAFPNLQFLQMTNCIVVNCPVDTPTRLRIIGGCKMVTREVLDGTGSTVDYDYQHATRSFCTKIAMDTSSTFNADIRISQTMTSVKQIVLAGVGISVTGVVLMMIWFLIRCLIFLCTRRQRHQQI